MLLCEWENTFYCLAVLFWFSSHLPRVFPIFAQCNKPPIYIKQPVTSSSLKSAPSTSSIPWRYNKLCLVPRPHFSVRPKRFGSRGPSQDVFPARSPRTRQWIDREGLRKCHTGTRLGLHVTGLKFKYHFISVSQPTQDLTNPLPRRLKYL